MQILHISRGGSLEIRGEKADISKSSSEVLLSKFDFGVEHSKALRGQPKS